MRPCLGDFLALASEHLETAIADGAKLPAEGACGVVWELSRVTAAMARIADAFVLNGGSDAAHPPDADAQAVLDAKSALRRAAARLRAAAEALGHGSSNRDHPVAMRLSAAAVCLAAGHDLLQAHFVPGPFGWRSGNSPWAPVIVSEPVNTALVAEMGRFAGRLAPCAIRLSSAHVLGDGLPTRAQAAVSAAGRWLRVAEAAAWAAGCHADDTATGRALLRAIPGNVAPGRHPPRGGEPVADLCAGITATAERLRHLAFVTATRLPPPKIAAAASWQRTAQGAAIVGHCSELTLRTLGGPSARIAVTPAASTALEQAADAASQAHAAWRAVAHAWDTFTTGPGQGLTPVAAEIGDLVLWAGRLTHTNRAWTPARDQASPLRNAADLTAGPGTAAGVLTALDDLSDGLAQIASRDRESVRAAAAANTIFVPSRLLPGDHDIPYRYVPAPAAMIDKLLTAYDRTIHSATRAATALTSLTRTLNIQPAVRAVLRAANQADPPHLPLTPAIPPRPPITQPALGRVERELRNLGITEPALLARASGLDHATQTLISEATAKAQRQATAKAPVPRTSGRSPARGQHPPRLAAKDSPSATTGSSTPLPRLVPVNHPIRHSTTVRRWPAP
jgi:hypothetical protein